MTLDKQRDKNINTDKGSDEYVIFPLTFYSNVGGGITLNQEIFDGHNEEQRVILNKEHFEPLINLMTSILNKQ